MTFPTDTENLAAFAAYVLLIVAVALLGCVAGHYLERHYER